jgi:protocatechuate 3,4-dioxygenase beta subunit
MRIVIACLVMLFPAMAFTSDASALDTKDKYVKCNCHLTPALPFKAVHRVKAVAHTPTEHKQPVKHKHHKKAVKKPETTADATPAPIKHKHHHISSDSGESHTSYAGQDYPGREGFVTTNKLALPAGKSIYSPGEIVYISGRVLDMRCVPVSDAIVEIWQANTEGKYVKSTLGERLSPAPHFTGTGRATTDNLGRFNFVTVFPGPNKGRAPYIHVHVIHKDFPSLNTEMFFGDDRRNMKDPVYSTMDDQQRTMVTAKVWQRDINDPEKGLGASWDISLNGKNPYRHF